MIDNIEAVRQVQYSDACIRALTKFPINGYIMKGYQFKFRRPKKFVVNNYSEIESQIRKYQESLPGIPLESEVSKLVKSGNVSIHQLLNSKMKSVIDEDILGWYNHDDDEIVFIIDTIEELARTIAFKFNIEFSEDYFYHFVRFEFLHELIHCTFDYDFNESQIFRHLTDSFANWLASIFLPRDDISRMIEFARVYHQPKEYGYSLLFGYCYNRNKYMQLLKNRIEHNHVDAVKMFYEDIIGYEWYSIDQDEILYLPGKVNRLYGLRNVYCIAGEDIDILGNISGLILARKINSIVGILPPNSFLIANQITGTPHYKYINYDNLFRVPEENLNIKLLTNNRQLSLEQLKKCYNRLYFANENNLLSDHKVLDIISITLNDECLSPSHINDHPDPITIYSRERKKELECNRCGNIVEFPYKIGNLIVTKGCSISGLIGEETFFIGEGNTASNCPPIEKFSHIEIKCICGNVLFTTKDLLKIRKKHLINNRESSMDEF